MPEGANDSGNQICDSFWPGAHNPPPLTPMERPSQREDPDCWTGVGAKTSRSAASAPLLEPATHKVMRIVRRFTRGLCLPERNVNHNLVNKFQPATIHDGLFQARHPSANAQVSRNAVSRSANARRPRVFRGAARRALSIGAWVRYSGHGEVSNHAW
jgi:hypothetical protein